MEVERVYREFGKNDDERTEADIALFLTRYKECERVVFMGVVITRIGATVIANFLRGNTDGIRHMVFARNSFGIGEIEIIADALKTNKTLTKLYIYDASLTVEIFRPIICAMLQNERIGVLSIQGGYAYKVPLPTDLASVFHVNDSIVVVIILWELLPSGDFNRLWGKRSRVFRVVKTMPDCSVEC